MPPEVSVVMSVYNGERYLREAVESILNQTFTDFEFIIIDDGSTDGTWQVLDEYACQEERIVLLQNEMNIGLTKSLNRGLRRARGDYVARMDADDISIAHRFERQLSFLEQHPEVGILGSGCHLIDMNGQQRGLHRMVSNDLQIRWTSLLANPFLHPTVMMRCRILTQYSLTYDEKFHTAQDYDLWTRMLKFTRGANLDEPLVVYRLCQNITSTQRDLQLKNHDAIALRTIQEELPGFMITREQVSQLRAMFVGGNEYVPNFYAHRVALAGLYLRMLKSFIAHHVGEPDLRALRRQEALRVAHLVLRRPVQPGWIPILGRLVSLDPGFPCSFLSHLSETSSRRLRKRAHDMVNLFKD